VILVLAVGELSKDREFAHCPHLLAKPLLDQTLTKDHVSALQGTCSLGLAGPKVMQDYIVGCGIHREPQLSVPTGFLQSA
jgi:hypothetical protein